MYTFFGGILTSASRIASSLLFNKVLNNFGLIFVFGFDGLVDRSLTRSTFGPFETGFFVVGLIGFFFALSIELRRGLDFGRLKI